MLPVTELRAGTVYEDQGQLFQILSYEHIKMGRGSANIKVKVRNIRSGATTDKSFINGARVNNVSVMKKDLQYLYKDEESAFFMDPISFEQIRVPIKTLGSEYQYLKESETYSLSFYQDEVLAINLPPKMEFTVVETGPSLRGNSATNIYKDATLENGIKTRVPLFIDIGARVRIDTRTGAYSEKVQ